MQPIINLRKREEKRLRNGHLWVFSNEIADVSGDPQAGDVVRVHRHGGAFLGQGLYNPRSLIAVRMLSASEAPIGPAFFEARFAAALTLRRSIYPDETAFRLVHGESDALPGLIVDVYGRGIALQVLSVGMETRLETITGALRALLDPSFIVARNDTPLRDLEGLPPESKVLHGDPVPVAVTEHGLTYEVDLLGGQKTGLFLDQKDNRLAIRRYMKGRRVLDCFSNVGGFGLNAAAAGAENVAVLDASASAISAARNNFARNTLPLRDALETDAFEYLASPTARAERLSGIILDPPAFTKSKKTVATALKAYRRLNMLAISALEPGGILVSASCSHHVTRDEFLNMLSAGSMKAGRSIRVLEVRGAAADHPVLPSMPETAYLKLAVCAVD